MPTTAFRTRKNGFHFANKFVNPIIGGYQTKGRCGGMAFASLDYYHAGIATPTHVPADFGAAGVPPDGTILADYIYKRLFDSFFTLSAAKFASWTERPDDDLKVGGFVVIDGVVGLTNAEAAHLKAAIDRGEPKPIGLVMSRLLTELGSDHQVVAYGYSGDVFNIYDNNAPDQEATLSRQGTGWILDTEDTAWRGFFIQDYTPVRPPYHDLELSAGLSVSSWHPTAGGHLDAAFTAKNVGQFTAHMQQYFLYIRGSQGQVQDDLLSGDDSGRTLGAGQTRTVKKSSDSFPAGSYTLSAGFITDDDEYETLPAGPPNTTTSVTVTAVAAPPPPLKKMTTSVSPYPIPLRQSVTVTFSATNVQTGADVQGEAYSNGAHLGSTGVPSRRASSPTSSGTWTATAT